MYMLVLTVLLVPYVTAHSEVIDKARAICEASCRVSYPGFRLIHCHEVSLVWCWNYLYYCITDEH